MHKLGFADASFLYLERDGAPMNIASVQRFAVPDSAWRAGVFVRRLKRYLAARVQGIEFMTSRLASTPFDLDQPAWVADTDFDIDNHVFQLRLPTPGTDRQLEALIARLHEQSLDRRRPLWAMYVIDGLSDGTFVLYSKYHHAALDGMSGQQVLAMLYSEDPESFPEPAEAVTAGAAGTARLLADALVNLSLQPLQQLGRSMERWQALTRIGERFRNGDAGAAASRAPHTPFNVPVSDYRSWASLDLPLSEIKALSRATGTSVNDVLLAICAGGLRRYLGERGSLPDAPLIAGVPVSLRARGDRGFGNQVGMLRASLETQREDPAEMLQAIAESTRAGKALMADSAALLPGDLHVPGAAALFRNAGEMARLLPQSLMDPACNVVISNVPGPRRTKYLLGCEMLTHHPVGIAADSCALNITVQTYGPRMDLGLTACLETVPDIYALRDALAESWAALKAALAHAAPLDEPEAASDAGRATEAA